MRTREEWRRRAKEYYQREAVARYDRSGDDYPAKLHDFMDRHSGALGSNEEYRDKFNALAEDYVRYAFDPLFEPTFVYVAAFIAEEIERRQPARVLESGCGVALQLAFLASEFPGVQFVGSDLAPKMIEVAGGLIQQQSLRNVSLFTLAHDQLDPQTIGGEVDLCLAVSCLFFKGLGEIAGHFYGFSKATKTNGKFVVTLPYEDYLAFAASVACLTGFSELKESWSMTYDPDRAQFALGVFDKIATPTPETLMLRIAVASQRLY